MAAELTPFEKGIGKFCNVLLRMMKNRKTVEEVEKEKPEILQLKQIDLRIKENTVAHHTEQFDITDPEAYDDTEQLVVRRGQVFSMVLEFNRPYDKEADDLRIIFEFGKNPLPPKGSRVELILSEEDIPNEWGAFIKAATGNSVTIAVMTPPNCAAAKWSLKIDVVKRQDKTVTVHRYQYVDPVYILFNPWCKDDQVYKEKDLEEYVLNDSGEIYKGSYEQITRCEWNFGQFSGNVLECVMYLLDDVSKMSDQARGDVVKVVREISSVVNSCDNAGVLVGNWAKEDESFKDGEYPWSWTGSVKILEKYLKDKSPVKYGQCWVFSGVVTTVCRALGIPTRSITNFVSAHDTDGSVNIDLYCNDDGEIIEELKDDSCWNFHVWNDVWMARPDLKPGFAGWQAIDATPQERSAGVYRMGPMPLKAIKEGELDLPYDGPFVFAEVNADMNYWGPNKLGYLSLYWIDKHHAGQYISTKTVKGRQRSSSKVGPRNRDDITLEYKYEEGSKEEQGAKKRANLHSSTKDAVYEEKEWDVDFKLDYSKGTMIGETVKISLKIKNKSKTEDKYINGTTKVVSTDYRGKVFKDILTEKLDWELLKAEQEKSFSYDVSMDKYYDKLTDQCYIKISCMMKVSDSDQIFIVSKEMALLKPRLTITAPEKGKVGELFKAEAKFDNPLPKPLTGCKVTVEGPGLQVPITFDLGDVAAKSSVALSFEFTPVKAGEKSIIVSFNSKELHSINGSCEINISKKA